VNTPTSRRSFLKRSVWWLAAIPSSLLTLLYVWLSRDTHTRYPPTAVNDNAPNLSVVSPATEVLTAHAYTQQLQAAIEAYGLSAFTQDFRALLQQTAQACVLEDGQWVIPSQPYANYFFVRDSFWLLAALHDRRLSSIAVKRFHGLQATKSNGQVGTALYRVPGAPPYAPDTPAPAHDDESTLLYILHNYLLYRLQGEIEHPSLERAYTFLLSKLHFGGYVTMGDQHSAQQVNTLGAYHYWADTFRPAGKPQATPEIITYNQGLLCVALRCLEAMGVNIHREVREQAERFYANVVNPADGRTLPQRAGSTVMDVSSLIGEALSLYWFDTPLLSDERVRATLEHFAPVRYPNGDFLGFKVISDFDGSYRPQREFIHPELNLAGHYHNGGSWLLYDALALYVGMRHHTPGATELFLRRLQSEVKHSRASHEFIITHPAHLGDTASERAGYGWNAFVWRLLPA
jgi:hypothetical protein